MGSPTRGAKTPVEDIGVDLPGDFGEAHDYGDDMPTFRLFSPGTSQFTPIAPLLIVGTDIALFD